MQMGVALGTDLKVSSVIGLKAVSIVSDAPCQVFAAMSPVMNKNHIAGTKCTIYE